MRPLLILSLFLIGLPLMVLAAIQLTGAGALISTFAVFNDMREQVDEKNKIQNADSHYQKDRKFVIVKENSRHFELAHPTFIKWNEYSRYKIIEVKVTVPFKDLLAENEAMPAKELVQMVADARSVNVMLQECDLIKQAFAENCKASKVSAHLTDLGHVVISAKLSFTHAPILPKTDDPVSAIYAFNTTETDFAGSKGNSRSDIRSGRSIREKIYANVSSQCQKFAAQQGSCSIIGISVKQTPQRGSQNSIVTSTRGAYGFLTELKRVEQ